MSKYHWHEVAADVENKDMANESEAQQKVVDLRPYLETS